MKNYQEFLVFIEYIIPFFRGLFYQIFFLNINGFLFIKSGCKIRGFRNIKWCGYLKFGEYSIINARHMSQLVFGKNCTVGDFTKITNSYLLERKSEISIGDNVSIGSFNTIQAGYDLYIGSNSFTAGYVGIYPENHVFDKYEKNYLKDKVNGKGIKIGSNVYICHGVVITDGVNIESKSLILPNTVVRG
jgi:acetyltransferase-like isoleucine patch superfamily enzyme